MGKRKGIVVIVLLILAVAACTCILINMHRKITEQEQIAAIEKTPPRVVLVDYDTEDAERVIGYLELAGFEAERSEEVDSLDPSRYDALIIPGGHNITPSVYGAERDKHTYGTDLEKDKMQINAIKKFVEAKKPILGICRGEQVLNVAFGGTINQHIPGWHKLYRDVVIQEGSWLYEAFGEKMSTYHFHHQCIDKLGEGLVATQWDAEDDHIEAIEHESLPVYGLQWHPDSMEETGVKVFESFKEIVIEEKLDSIGATNTDSSK